MKIWLLSQEDKLSFSSLLIQEIENIERAFFTINDIVFATWHI